MGRHAREFIARFNKDWKMLLALVSLPVCFGILGDTIWEGNSISEELVFAEEGVKVE